MEAQIIKVSNLINYDFALDKNIVPPALPAEEQTQKTEEKNEPADEKIIP